VPGGGGEVGPDGAEGLGSGHGPHAPGDLDPELTHPDHPFRFIVVEGNPQVTGEPQVVAGPFQHPGGQGVAFLLQLGAAGRVERVSAGFDKACSVGRLAIEGKWNAPLRMTNVILEMQRDERVATG